MFLFILLIISGTLLVYLAQNNLTPVTVQIGSYFLTDIPLFYVIMGSLLTGLLLSYIFFLANALSSSWTLRGKNSVIKHKKTEVAELTKRIHQLELENEKLRHQPVQEIDADAL